MNTLPPARRPPGAASETYTHGYTAPVLDLFAGRTAGVEAGFLLPHLRAGRRLLDVGCGGGSITLGLAAAVAPGEVVGVDREPAVVAQARARAAEQGLATARFEVADVYALPFPDASFDAAFGHTVLQHLRDPVAALREVRRVLRPGGVVGVREGDWGTRIVAPPGSAVEETVALYLRLWEHNGGNPYSGRLHRALLRAAGFARTEAEAVTVSFRASAGAGGAATVGAPEDTRRFAAICRRIVEAPEWGDQMVALGWVDAAARARLAAGCRAWGEDPDAFSTMVVCQTLGWAE